MLAPSQPYAVNYDTNTLQNQIQQVHHTPTGTIVKVCLAKLGAGLSQYHIRKHRQTRAFRDDLFDGSNEAQSVGQNYVSVAWIGLPPMKWTAPASCFSGYICAIRFPAILKSAILAPNLFRPLNTLDMRGLARVDL